MSHSGRLLVATPLIGDPNFERTVILLLAHGDGGAFGVVLNRPSDTPVGDVVEAWAGACAPPAALFLGGPVGLDAVVGLGRCADGVAHGFDAVVGSIGTVDLNRPPAPGDPTVEARLFAGSAGWAAGQLEDELAEGAWWLVDAHPTDPLTTDPSGLWRTVVSRQPGKVAWFARHPGDPTVN